RGRRRAHRRGPRRRRVPRGLAVLAGAARAASRARGARARGRAGRRVRLFAHLPARDAGARHRARAGAGREQRRGRHAELPRRAPRGRDADRARAVARGAVRLRRRLRARRGGRGALRPRGVARALRSRLARGLARGGVVPRAHRRGPGLRRRRRDADLHGALARGLTPAAMRRVLVALVLLGLFAAFFALGLQRYFTPEYFQAQRAAIAQLASARPVATAAAFFAIYVVLTGLSLPVAALLTLAAGAIFGLLWGTIVVSFASCLGATLA